MKDSTENSGLTHAAQAVSDAISDIPQRAQRCFIEENLIVFNFDDFTYEVPLAQCDSYAKILAWQLHLSEKRWMTVDLLMQFTIMACDHHELPISRG